MKRGQVYYADLNPVIGSEQGGIRPCLIIQNNTGNLHSPTVIIAAMTTQCKANMPTHVAVSSEDYCLDINTKILLEQLRTIDKSRMRDFVGRLSNGTMKKVDETLHISLALNKEEREVKNVDGLQIFNNENLGLKVRTILNEDGSISVNAEDTAIGFGWTTVAKSGNEAVRWARVNEYCKDIGFFQNVGKDDFIPESLFYRLAMKASNERAEKFQNWLAIEVIPEIRKTGGYQKKLSPVEMMRIQLGMIDELGDRVTALENTSTIDHGQQRILENTVNKTVVSVLGGKESNAYKEIGRKVFAECNRDLKNYFKVNSRDDVPRLHYEDAIKYAEDWKPCTNTMMMISDCNAQINM